MYYFRPTEQLTEAEKKREEAIMEEIVTLVNKRDKIMEQIENEREETHDDTPADLPAANPKGKSHHLCSSHL